MQTLFYYAFAYIASILLSIIVYTLFYFKESNTELNSPTFNKLLMFSVIPVFNVLLMIAMGVIVVAETFENKITK